MIADIGTENKDYDIFDTRNFRYKIFRYFQNL